MRHSQKLLLSLFFITLFTACLRLPSSDWNKSLPDTSELGKPQEYTILRVITHFHSVFSYDACDKLGIENGRFNEACLAHLREAMCENRVNYLFLTDHPPHMADYEIQDLLLSQGNDEFIYKNGVPVGSTIGNCINGSKPVITTGFEGRILALGMERHLETDQTLRREIYGDENLQLRNRLRDEAGAIVAIPHTERWSYESMLSLAPDAIEIYNIHANLDPKIRRKDLELPPFENLANLLMYLIDPLKRLTPDLAFLGFFEVHPIYSKRWNQLLDSGLKVTGIVSNDSHENIFAQKASDGERLDSHRRLTRMISNYVLVRENSLDSVKQALKKGQSWNVFEGFGSPEGFDFYAQVGQQKIVVGETLNFSLNETNLFIKAPYLNQNSPGADQGDKPLLKIVIKKVLQNGMDEVVTSSNGSDIYFQLPSSGIYRAEVYIVPKHLKKWLGDFIEYAEESYPWIITNHIYLP